MTVHLQLLPQLLQLLEVFLYLRRPKSAECFCPAMEKQVHNYVSTFQILNVEKNYEKSIKLMLLPKLNYNRHFLDASMCNKEILTS